MRSATTQSLVVTGMTCEACEYKIKYLFEQIADIQSVDVNLQTSVVAIESKRKVSIDEFLSVLKPYPKYNVSDYKSDAMAFEITNAKQQKNKASTYDYYPLVLIFGFIASVSLSTTYQHSGGVVMFLHSFMTGFFLVFSFFKLLNVKAFADSFQMYDLLAARSRTYALAYPFVELALGVACLLHFQLRWVYIADIVIMGFGAIGVIQSVLDKRKIQCACLGSVFDLPMSTITIIENSIMVAVGLALLFLGVF
jgi:cation transport ATPase